LKAQKEERLVRITKANEKKREIFKDITEQLNNITVQNDSLIQDLVYNLEKVPKKSTQSSISKSNDQIRNGFEKSPKITASRILNGSRENSLEYTNKLSNGTKNERSSYILARRETLDTLQSINQTQCT
jgi:CRISPR/Cas system-associated protein Csx1